MAIIAIILLLLGAVLVRAGTRINDVWTSLIGVAVIISVIGAVDFSVI